MKKILIIALTFIAMSVGSLHGQIGPLPSDIFIIGTSIIEPPNKITGLYRSDPNRSFDPILYKRAPIHFIISSLEKNYEIWLQHFSYHLSELAKRRPTGPSDSMVFCLMSLSELSSLNTIDVDQFISSHNREQAHAWARANYRKRVWVIDRNDFYKSSSSLPENDMMKLTEVGISLFNLPHTFD